MKDALGCFPDRETRCAAGTRHAGDFCVFCADGLWNPAEHSLRIVFVAHDVLGAQDCADLVFIDTRIFDSEPGNFVSGFKFSAVRVLTAWDLAGPDDRKFALAHFNLLFRSFKLLMIIKRFIIRLLAC